MQDLERIFNQTLDVVKECGNILKGIQFEEEAVIKSDGSLVTKYDLMDLGTSIKSPKNKKTYLNIHKTQPPCIIYTKNIK